MRAKRKRARGQFPRRRAGYAVHVLSFIFLLVAVDRVPLTSLLDVDQSTSSRPHVMSFIFLLVAVDRVPLTSLLNVDQSSSSRPYQDWSSRSFFS